MGSILYEQTELTNVHSNVTLNHGVIQLNPLTSQIYGGQKNGSVTVDTRPNPDDLCGQCQAHRRGREQTAVVALVGQETRSTARWPRPPNLTFATPASGDVVQTLNGTLGLNLTNGKLTKLDLVNELSKIGKFSGAGTRPRAIPASRR